MWRRKDLGGEQIEDVAREIDDGRGDEPELRAQEGIRMAKAVADVQGCLDVGGWVMSLLRRRKRQKLDRVGRGDEHGLGEESANDAHVGDRDSEEVVLEASHLEGRSVATQTGLHEDGNELLIDVE